MSSPLVTDIPRSHALIGYGEDEVNALLMPSAADANADEQRQQQDYPSYRGEGVDEFRNGGVSRSGGGGRMDILGTTIEVIHDDCLAEGGNSNHRQQSSRVLADPIVPRSGGSFSVRQDVFRAQERRRASLRRLHGRRGSLGSVSAASSGGMGGGSERGSLCSSVIRNSAAAPRSGNVGIGEERNTRKYDDDDDDDDEEDDVLIDDFVKALGLSVNASDNCDQKNDHRERSGEEDMEDDRPIADDCRRSNSHRLSSSSTSTSTSTPPHDHECRALQSSLSASSVLRQRRDSRRASLQQYRRRSSSASSVVSRRGSVGSNQHGEKKESIIEDLKKLEADLASLPLVINDDKDKGFSSSVKSKEGAMKDKVSTQGQSRTKYSSQVQDRRRRSSNLYLDSRRNSQLTLTSVDETGMIDVDNDGDYDGYIFDDGPGEGESPRDVVFQVDRSALDAVLPDLAGVGGCDDATTPCSSRRASHSSLARRRRSSAALSRGSSLKSTLMNSFRSLTESLEDLVDDISDGDNEEGERNAHGNNGEGSKGHELLQGFPTRLQGCDSGEEFSERNENNGLL